MARVSAKWAGIEVTAWVKHCGFVIFRILYSWEVVCDLKVKTDVTLCLFTEPLQAGCHQSNWANLDLDFYTGISQGKCTTTTMQSENVTSLHISSFFIF